MRITFAFLFMSMALSLPAQQLYLSAEIKNLPSKEIYLASFYGEKNSIVDTAFPDQAGKFSFELKKEYNAGMYRMFLDKKVFIDVVYNHENISLTSDFEFP